MNRERGRKFQLGRAEALRPRALRRHAGLHGQGLRGGGLASCISADDGGAALVEFAFAIMPILCLFFGMIQWTLCAYTHTILQHAAMVAARAEAVEYPGMPDNGGATGSTSDLRKAVTPLFVHVYGLSGLWLDLYLSIKVPTQAKSPCDQTPNMVQLTLEYPCSIPLGNVLVCGGFFASVAPELPMYIKLTSSASFPNQGSYYESVWSSKIGGSVTCSAAK